MIKTWAIKVVLAFSTFKTIKSVEISNDKPLTIIIPKSYYLNIKKYHSITQQTHAPSLLNARVYLFYNF